MKKGKLVSIRKPSLEELDYVKWLWGDEETNKLTGGPYPFPTEKKTKWFEIMVEPGNGENVYCLIFNQADQPVGEVSFHQYDPTSGSAEFNIKVAANKRGKGYGKEAVTLMLDFFFNDWGGEVMRDPIAPANKEGQNTLLQLGFQHVESNEDAFLVEMTKERYKMVSQHGVRHHSWTNG